MRSEAGDDPEELLAFHLEGGCIVDVHFQCIANRRLESSFEDGLLVGDAELERHVGIGYESIPVDQRHQRCSPGCLDRIRVMRFDTSLDPLQCGKPRPGGDGRRGTPVLDRILRECREFVAGRIESIDIAVHQFGAFLRNTFPAALSGRHQTHAAADKTSSGESPNDKTDRRGGVLARSHVDAWCARCAAGGATFETRQFLFEAADDGDDAGVEVTPPKERVPCPRDSGVVELRHTRTGGHLGPSIADIDQDDDAILSICVSDSPRVTQFLSKLERRSARALVDSDHRYLVAVAADEGSNGLLDRGIVFDHVGVVGKPAVANHTLVGAAVVGLLRRFLSDYRRPGEEQSRREQQAEGETSQHHPQR